MLRPKFAEKSATQRQADIRNKAKQKRPTSSDAFISFLNSDCSLNLTGAQAACADINGLMCTVYYCLNLSYVRLPHSACLSVGVGNIVTECNSFLTEFALCHLKLPSSNKNQVHHDTKRIVGYVPYEPLHQIIS
jgi:hypothetical protein